MCPATDVPCSGSTPNQLRGHDTYLTTRGEFAARLVRLSRAAGDRARPAAEQGRPRRNKDGRPRSCAVGRGGIVRRGREIKRVRPRRLSCAAVRGGDRTVSEAGRGGMRTARRRGGGRTTGRGGNRVWTAAGGSQGPAGGGSQGPAAAGGDRATREGDQTRPAAAIIVRGRTRRRSHGHEAGRRMRPGAE